MQVISSGGIPLALALGVRGIRLASPGWLVAAWLVAAWQLSLGFAIGLPFAYLLGLLVLVGTVVWWRRGRPPVDRRCSRPGPLLVAFLVIGGLVARPYFRVADAHPEATRLASTVEAYSGPLGRLRGGPGGEPRLGTSPSRPRPARERAGGDPVPGGRDPAAGGGGPRLPSAFPAGCASASAPASSRLGCWRSASRWRTGGSGPTGSSTSCCRGGRRSARRAACRLSPRSGSRFWRPRGRTRSWLRRAAASRRARSAPARARRERSRPCWRR